MSTFEGIKPWMLGITKIVDTKCLLGLFFASKKRFFLCVCFYTNNVLKLGFNNFCSYLCGIYCDWIIEYYGYWLPKKF